MTAIELRKQLQGYIEIMPEKNLEILAPLLSALAEPLYTIEPATLEDAKKIKRRMKDYENDPSSFIAWKDIRRV